MDEVKHDGILGMKWGRRRYRNYDGTLTEEGKKRYDYSHGKDSGMITDEELRQRIDRLTLEKRYRDLLNEVYGSQNKEAPKKDPSAKRKEFIDFIMDAGKVVAFTASVASLAKQLKGDRKDDYDTKLQKDVKRMTLEKQKRTLTDELKKSSAASRNFSTTKVRTGVTGKVFKVHKKSK